MIDPQGIVLAKGNADEVVMHAEITAARVIETRERFPFLRDRR